MRFYLISLLSLVTTYSCFAQTSDQLQYIERYKDIAIMEMDRAGIPASIKLAQGLLESAAGTSYLATSANNHFGVKCGNNWDGKTIYRKDDDYDEHGELQKSCFRVYKSAEDSYIAHSEFLRDPFKEYRYGFLFRIDPSDYVSWARGLKKSGYATSATYDKKLISIIERYDLHRYDMMRAEDVIPGLTVTKSEGDRLAGITYNNDVKVVIVGTGDTPASIAERSGVPIDKLRKYNESLPGRDATIPEGQFIYLESKRNSYRGNRKYHYVQQGETMYEISQKYGMKLKKLYSRNMMPEGSQPAAGEQIRLRGTTRKEEDRPKLSTEAPSGGIAFMDEEELDLDDDFWSPAVAVPVSNPTKPPINDPNEEELDPIQPISPPVIRPVIPEPEVDEVIIEPVRPEETYHTVIKGDTLYSLSKRYGTTVDKLKQLNNLSSNIISVGQKLRIKG
ncbi:MAG: LysM peptidoglycan-binding domain-containing protein [Saprospiraceae bacterium]|nr:LysM peptidoglycan-binding domain-containing protein [Saprospiraceae bacterium]